VAEQEVRVYLPEVRPARYSGASPGWFRWSVGGALAVTLGALSVGQDWPSDVVALALEVTGRDEPVINDIVTLSWDGGVDTRTWDGVKWIPLRNFVDGSVFVPQSITGDKFAANSIAGDRIFAGTLDGDRFAANSVSGQHIQAGQIQTRHIIATESVFTNSIQVGAGNVEVENLEEAILPSYSNNIRGINIPRGSTWRRLQNNFVAQFERTHASEVIAITVNMSANLLSSSLSGAWVQAIGYVRARIGSDPNDFAASTIYADLVWASQAKRVGSSARWRSGNFIREALGFGTYYFVGGQFDGLVSVPAPSDAARFSRWPTYELPLSLSPINQKRYVFLDGYFVFTEDRGTRERNRYYDGNPIVWAGVTIIGPGTLETGYVYSNTNSSGSMSVDVRVDEATGFQ